MNNRTITVTIPERIAEDFLAEDREHYPSGALRSFALQHIREALKTALAESYQRPAERPSSGWAYENDPGAGGDAA